jgi:4-hydroxy-tetrahydrodipicolinate synthase
MKLLQGVWTAMISPFDSHGEVCTTALSSYLDFQREAGVSGMVVSGTNGEGPSLSMTERMRLLEATIERWPEGKVVAATATSSLPEAIELTHHAADVGAVAIMALPPFFFKKVSAEGITAFYLRLLDASRIPVYLYNIPHQTYLPIGSEVLDRLANHPILAGMKDSAGNWDDTQMFIRSYPHLQILPGSDELAGAALSAGCEGIISGSANAFPERAVAVQNAVVSGEGLEAAQEALTQVKKIFLDYPLIAGSKSILSHRGVCDVTVRPPLVELSLSQRAELNERLVQANLLPA